MRQMQKVNTAHGAPMGRHSFGLIQNQGPRTVRLFRVNLDSGGYDDGGAYWGHGEPIFCATDGGEYFQTVRASNRVHAALLLDIRPEQLRAPIGALVWHRWDVVKAYIGKPSPVFEVREFGKPVGYVGDWDGLCHFAQTGEGLHLYTSKGASHD